MTAAALWPSAFYHFARINAGLRETAAKQFLGGDQPMLRIEPEGEEDFVRQAGQMQAQIVAHRAGRREGRALPDFLAERAPRHFEHRLQLRVLGRPHAGHRREFAAARREQAGQAAEAGDQLARQIDRAFAGHPDAQENGQQFGVRQGARTLRQQALAGAFVGRPIGDRHDVSQVE